jgi:1,4-dihydroxy-2-naphthoate octaprenyltransferase
MKLLHIGLAVVRLGRLQFLVGGIVLHLLGVAIALNTGAPLNIAALVWGQIVITATQLMTQYANEYFDQAADRANPTPTNWSGGSRVLVDSTISPRAALILSLVCAGIALAANVVISTTIRSASQTFLLLITAQALAWFYSAPPLRLHSRGLGELTTTIIVPFLTPLTGFYLQTDEITLLPMLAVLPLCCFQFAMMLAIEFPDAVGDSLAGKRTLVVQLGGQRSAWLYGGLVIGAYAMLPPLVAFWLPALAAWAIAGLSPLGIWQVWRVFRGVWRDPRRWNLLAFHSIALLIGSAALELFVFGLLVGM